MTLPGEALAQGDLCVVHNPAAGRNRLANIEELAAAAGRRVVVRPTARAGDGTDLAARAAAEGFPIVVAAGGDGTVNEVACGLLGTGAALGIVPAGSGNGLARHLGMPFDAGTVLRRLGSGGVAPIDVGYLNAAPFFCTAGLGFDAHVAQHFARAGKRGFATYLKTALSRYPGYRARRATIRLNDLAIELDLFVAAFANASQYGNDAFIAPHADIADGLLDACVLARLSPLRAARVAWALMNGSLPALQKDSFHAVVEARVETDEDIEYHLDGDFRGLGREFSVTVERQALEVALC